MTEEQLDGLTPTEMAEALPDTTPAEVIAGEAPADEITTLTPEPQETIELTPPTEAESEEAVAVESAPEVSPETEVEQANMDTHSENEPEAGQDIAESTQVNLESTDNPETITTNSDTTSHEAPTSTPTQPVDEWQTYIASINAGTNTNLQMIVSTVSMYSNVMAPRTPVNIKGGSEAQVMLWHALVNTIVNNNTNFKDAWTLWLNMFNHYSEGMFSVRYALRFFEFIRLPRDQIIAFQRVLNLLILTANPETRAANLKRVSLEMTFSTYFNEAAKQKVMAFYLS